MAKKKQKQNNRTANRSQRQSLPVMSDQEYIQRMLGMAIGDGRWTGHQGLMYLDKQWVLTDRDAVSSAATLVWRKKVTVAAAGPKRVMVAGRHRDRWNDEKPSAVIEIWEGREKVAGNDFDSQEELETAMYRAYDAIEADKIDESTEKT